MSTTAPALISSVAAIAELGADPSCIQQLGDDELTRAGGLIATSRRHLDAYAGAVAAEISRRSRRDLGYAGLAQRQGFRTPEAMIQQLTGSTRADAVAVMNVGTMIAETAAHDLYVAGGLSPGQDVDGEQATRASTERWDAEISRRVMAGQLTFAQADAIRVGLGEETEQITGPLLADAARSLIDIATEPGPSITVEQLRRLARQFRDRLDVDGLAEREDEQRCAHYLKVWQRADGMVAGSVLLDRENGAYLLSVIDQITSPRRGGPRFTSEKDQERAKRLVDDPRSTERIAVESIIELIRLGVNADPGSIVGAREPAVRIVVTRETLDTTDGPHGRGVIEATGESVTRATVERLICEIGSVTVTVDPSGRPLDVGREQRLFTKRQRIALAVRDGGCIFPRCDRPPSWTEAHHVEHWHDDRGKTNIDDGILLCRHHHLLLHNNGWRIVRRGSEYYLRPPASEDPDQTLRLLESKSPLMRERRADVA